MITNDFSLSDLEAKITEIRASVAFLDEVIRHTRHLAFHDFVALTTLTGSVVEPTLRFALARVQLLRADDIRFAAAAEAQQRDMEKQAAENQEVSRDDS